MAETVVVVEEPTDELSTAHRLGKTATSTLAGFVASEVAGKLYVRALYAYRARRNSN